LLLKMMNTQVVLLPCDKGTAASDSALSGYWQNRRLLITVIKVFPLL
jgi:hypothetical protein